MKVALIGASGFVGARILNELLDREHEVTAVVRRTERLTVRPGLTPQKADVLEVEALADLLTGHDAIIAAFNPDEDAGDKFEAMRAGAKAIIAAAAGLMLLLGAGCTDNPTANAATGAAVGGVLGNQVGSGKGKTAATIAGATAGAAIGANAR